MFELYETVIDVRNKEVVTIEHILDSSLYVVKDFQGIYYITDETALIKYDKYYFGEEA